MGKLRRNIKSFRRIIEDAQFWYGIGRWLLGIVTDPERAGKTGGALIVLATFLAALWNRWSQLPLLVQVVSGVGVLLIARGGIGWLWYKTQGLATADNLRHMSAKEFGRRCQGLAQDIQEIHTEYQNLSIRGLFRPGSYYQSADVSEEEKEREFWRQNRRHSREKNKIIGKYLRKYDGDAQAYLDECVRRGVLDSEKRERMRSPNLGASIFTIQEISQTLASCGRKLIG